MSMRAIRARVTSTVWCLRLALLLCVCGMEASSSAQRPLYRDELYAPPSAQNVTVLKDYDGGVKYRVLIAFPAQGLIDALNRHLLSRGFHPVTTDLFGQFNSHTRGWMDFEDDTRSLYVWQWLGDWENDEGDRSWATFRYEAAISPTETPPDLLQVGIIYMSAGTVVKVKEAAKRMPTRP